MLVTQERNLNSVFERLIRDKNGVLFRVRFTIVNVNGKPQPHVLSAEALIKNKETVICLPEVTEKIFTEYNYIPNFVSEINSYLSLEFLMSQPTRAPSM